MPRRKKSDDTLTVSWVKDLPPLSRGQRQSKYLPILEKLSENEGKLALLASDLTNFQATARVVSLKLGAKRHFPSGTFRFPARRTPDGNYSVFGICES